MRPTIDSHHIMYLSRADERASIATHALGFLLSIAVGGFLWWRTSGLELGLRLSCVVFATSMATVYLFSTLSHAVYEPWRRIRMRAWDQGTIYLLIAGTYSPFIWQFSFGVWRVLLMTAVWLAAGFGFYSKVFSTYRVNAVSTVTYVALGWFPAMALVSTTPVEGLIWMIAGGLCYTLGIIFLIGSHWFTYAHAVWHIFVMAGSACHTYAIYRICTGAIGS